MNTRAAMAFVLAWVTVTAAAQPAAPPAFPREATVTAIPGVVAAGARWELVWQGTDNADGLVGTEDDGVLFAQEQPNRIGKLDGRGHYSVFLAGTRGAGSLSIDAAGRLLAVERTCTDPGRRAGGACSEPTAVSVIAPERTVLADRFEDGTLLGRLNDLAADRLGGAYFTVGGVHYVDAHGRVTRLGDDLSTNGIALSPDEKTLYVTNRESVVAFDVANDGGVSNRRRFADLEGGGVGDGMTVDAAGRIYVTSAPGIQVFAASGTYLGVIPAPRQTISAAFSGPGKRWLYVVGGGAALGPNGAEFATPEGVRNNAKTIYRIATLAAGSRYAP